MMPQQKNCSPKIISLKIKYTLNIRVCLKSVMFVYIKYLTHTSDMHQRK